MPDQQHPTQEAAIDLARAMRAEVIGLHYLPDNIVASVMDTAADRPDAAQPIGFTLATMGTVPVELNIGGHVQYAHAQALHVSLLQLPHLALLSVGIDRLLNSRPDLTERWLAAKEVAINTLRQADTVARDIESDTEVAAELLNPTPPADDDRPGHGGYV